MFPAASQYRNLAVHFIIIIMVLQVYFPYLLLNGPTGSMAKAAQTMLQEQEHDVLSFVFGQLLDFMATTVIF